VICNDPHFSKEEKHVPADAYDWASVPIPSIVRLQLLRHFREVRPRGRAIGSAVSEVIDHLAYMTCNCIATQLFAPEYPFLGTKLFLASPTLLEAALFGLLEASPHVLCDLSIDLLNKETQSLAPPQDRPSKTAMYNNTLCVSRFNASRSTLPDGERCRTPPPCLT
jgi:hypothetical protein